MKKNLLLTILIAFTLSTHAQVKYYINSNVGQPWGQTTNINSMNSVFGVGNWTQAYFETVNVVAMLQPSVCFIFMDGSDNNASALNSFLAANTVLLQNWVQAGGKLLLNAAPNMGGNINFGFGGNMLVYPGASSTASNSPGLAAHPAFNGPALPAGTAYTGGSYSHAYIGGGISMPVMDGTSGPVMTEQFYGLGRVMFGGMTTTNFHSPAPNATNFRNNLFSYLGGCCGATASITVVPSTTLLCVGQSATLTASGATGGTYTLFPGNITGTSVVVSPTATTIYNFVGTPTAGCSGGVTIKLTTTVSPTVSVAGSSVICSGAAITLTASGATSYTWSNGALTATTAVTPTANVTYTVTGSNGACSSMAFKSITVNPTPTVTISGSTLICGTGTNVLTAGGANTYSWNTGAITASINVSPSVTTVYTVVGTNTLGNCPNTNTVSVTVSGNPTVSVTGSLVICNGQTTNLTASGASTYSWSNGVVTATAALSPTTTTSYTVVGTNTAGCMGISLQTLTVNPSPAVSIAGNNTICVGETSTLTASGAPSYSWNTGAVTSSIVVSPTITTSYTTVGTGTNGCTGTAVNNVVVYLCTGVAGNNIALNGSLVYPNPSNGEFTVELKNGLTKTITITDFTGRVVLTTTSAKDVINVSLSSLANGIYNVKVQSNNTSQVHKVVKQ